MDSLRGDRNLVVKSDMWDVRIATGKILAVAFLTILAGFSAGRVRCAEPPPARGKATETNAAANADGAGSLLTEANERKEKMLKICVTEQYKFTPKVREAFLAYAKAQARSDLQSQGKSLPDEFLAWIDANPEMEASVYGARHKASDVLLLLYSLRLDLGKAAFEKYRQLALAAAIVHVKQGLEVDITPRPPLKLVINGDPRKPVDTKEPGRTLDMNDHIINFLNDNTIEEDVVVGYKKVLPELKYDERGVAIPAPKRKPKKVAVTEKRTRTLYAADVLASKALQEKFNAYMKAKGQAVRIDCGERVIHWNSHDMVHGEEYKKIKEAYLLFRTAYEAKGLLPAKRDPIPSPAERCAYLIRNNEYKFPPETQAQRKWPRFPLTAPWPILTMLAADNQPLREREERWVAFRDKGEFRTYGEYIGGIAQQHAMQSARRLKPYPFTYSTIQMMLKDGGVCGTMAAISARSHAILGIPACQASQPGHCAMVSFRYDPKTRTYSCKGGQYATGGDDKTTPFTPWFFGEERVKRTGRKNGYEISFHQRKPMVYHQSIAWAVNYGMRSYLDSTMAYAVFRLLPEPDRQAHGVSLLESGLAINPYNFLLVDAAQAAASTPQEQIRFWKTFCAMLAATNGKPGCPVDGLYNKTVKNHMFARIAKLPVPKDKRTAGEVFAFLEKEKCDIPATLVTYRLAIEGLPALLSRTEQDFKEHLKSVQAKASRENDVASAKMAATIKATANCIKNKEARKQWALTLWKQAQGHEKYFGHRCRVSTDASVPVLARLSGQKMSPELELMKPLLNRVASELKQSVAGKRNLKACRLLAAKIKAAGNSLKQPEQKRQWLESLSKVMAGHETFQPGGAKKNAKPLRDPCSDTINRALARGEGERRNLVVRTRITARFLDSLRSLGMTR